MTPPEYDASIFRIIETLREIDGEVSRKVNRISADLARGDCDYGEGDCNEVLSSLVDELKEFQARVKISISVLSGKNPC